MIKMRALLLRLALLAAALLAPSGALAQSTCPYIAFGAVLTAAQWNQCFANKQDFAPLANSVSNSDGTLTISPTTGAVVASLALGHANTWTATQTFSAGIFGGGSIGSDVLEATGTTTFNGGVTIASASLTFSGNQSVAAWTTNGVRIKGVTGTLTDTTSSGTVAVAYTDVLGGNTIAASSATTYTSYVSLYLRAPVQGTNVTFTNGWALGADSLTLGTPGNVLGKLAFTNTSSGSITLQAPTGALGTPVLGIPAATDTLVGKATTDIFTNKTLTSTTNVLGGVTMTLGSDANFDIYYRNSSGVLTRLAAGTAGQVLSTNSTVSAPTWIPVGGTGTVTSVVCASTTITTTGTCYSAGQIVGTATNDNATAGNFGELQRVSTNPGTSLTSTVAADCQTLTLGAGDWDVRGAISYNPAGSTVIATLIASLSTTANTLQGLGDTSETAIAALNSTANDNPGIMVGPHRFSLSGSTTLHLVGYARFTTNTMNFAACTLEARRAR